MKAQAFVTTKEEYLPAVFYADIGLSRPLQQVARRASKNFRWGSKQSREDVMVFAYWLHASGRKEEALEVAHFLAQATFNGGGILWSYLEIALALEAFILRNQGKNEEAAICVGRIRAVNEAISSSVYFEKRFVEGDGVEIHEINADHAVVYRSKANERAFLTSALWEICTLLAMDVCRHMPAEVLEERHRQDEGRLAKLLATK